ncbi:MAG: DUF1292 domain-containing protein [Cellulosilyticaceae bacterium]
METITFIDELGEEITFEVIDQVNLDGIQYLLVADEDDEAIILKAMQDQDDEITYELIEDENEFKQVALHFFESDEYDIEV